MRLYADCLHGEYGDLDSDYVFVSDDVHVVLDDTAMPGPERHRPTPS